MKLLPVLCLAALSAACQSPADDLISQGRAAMKSRNYVRASDLFMQACKKAKTGEDLTVAYIWLAASARKEGDFPRALAVLQRSMHLHEACAGSSYVGSCSIPETGQFDCPPRTPR